jgi:hypothetical protein
LILYRNQNGLPLSRPNQLGSAGCDGVRLRRRGVSAAQRDDHDGGEESLKEARKELGEALVFVETGKDITIGRLFEELSLMDRDWTVFLKDA